MRELLMAGGMMAGLGVALSILLALANKTLYVYEDPRIDQVEEMLPRANCGACGFAGCRAFAEKLVSGEALPGRCTVSSAETVQALAAFLGVEAGIQEKRVARLACAGGTHVSHFRARYQGMPSCRAASVVAGGGKGCAWGCLGFGDCKDVCDFGAIQMGAFGLPAVDEAKCTACGACVAICPRRLYSIHPVSHRLWVACRNRAPGDTAELDCEVACVACGRCAHDAAPGLVAIQNYLAVVDYTKNALATPEAIQRCPTGAMVWIEEDGTRSKGLMAKRVVRHSPLPVG